MKLNIRFELFIFVIFTFKRKSSWWKTLIRAGIGVGDEPPEIPNRIQSNRSSNLNNEINEQQNYEKTPINNGSTGKCVTLQQYKEQGAPKYAVVARFVSDFLYQKFHVFKINTDLLDICRFK